MIISPSQGVRKGPSPSPSPHQVLTQLSGAWPVGPAPSPQGAPPPRAILPSGLPNLCCLQRQGNRGQKCHTTPLAGASAGAGPCTYSPALPRQHKQHSRAGTQHIPLLEPWPNLAGGFRRPRGLGGGVVVKDRMGGPTSSHPSRCVQKRGLRREVRVGQGACGRRASSQRVGWVTLDITVSVLSS